MTCHRSRSRDLPPSPSMAKLRSKLSRIVSRHDQLKLSFSHLKSQIKIGLLEAEDVFSSLAVPLMKLVGLKSAEMADEGRSSTILMKISLHAQVMYLTVVLGTREDMIRVDTHKTLSTAETENSIHRLELEEDYTNSVMMAGKEMIQTQKSQLVELLQILKQVESCVNSSQKSMFQTIYDHKDSIETFIQKAASYVSVIQESSHDDRACTITLKLLKAIHEHVCAVLSSVGGGVENLVKILSEQMGRPMMEYVKSFKTEMTEGTCHRLLIALEDMREVARDRRVELAQAREKVRAAEERTLQALRKLRESEERMKKINERQESTRHYPGHKLLPPHDDQSQTKDEKLLWELLKMKRACQQPRSPFGAQELIPVGTSSKHHKSTIKNISKSTPSYTKSKAHSLLPLGASPSVPTKQPLPRKHLNSHKT
ncbi:hypothetical protein L2E82_46336 [Cichorium intybus]|uniref:Uncharacterized protein n=1 Tax=Cichorium intybus TaxID=13427 RepID=A0ACB8YTK1_CICIN|nr:hypothetical protein L2E82_46336 [Cichorium intybus]